MEVEEEKPVIMRKHVSETPIRRPLSLARMGERRSVCVDSPTTPTSDQTLQPFLTRAPFHGTSPNVSTSDNVFKVDNNVPKSDNNVKKSDNNVNKSDINVLKSDNNVSIEK